jgi:hypothetical protein
MENTAGNTILAGFSPTSWLHLAKERAEITCSILRAAGIFRASGMRGLERDLPPVRNGGKKGIRNGP